MGDFKKRGGFGGGKPSFGGPRRDFGSRPSFGGGSNYKREDRGSAQMFTATCAACNKQCEVPFRPNGEKPVYCRDCFRNQNDAPTNNFAKRPSANEGVPSEFGERSAQRQQAAGMRGNRPNVRAVQTPDRRIDDLKRQLDQMSSKLDNLIALVSPVKIEKEKEIKSEAVKKAVASAVKVTVKKKLVKAKKA